MTIGLSLEKLVVVLALTSFVIGPARLPGYVARLAEIVRGVRAYVEATRTRTEDELGVPLAVDQWRDAARRYDPRRVVRDALVEPAEPAQPVQHAHHAGAARPAEPAEPAGAAEPAVHAEPAEPAGAAEPAVHAEPAEPAWRWVIAGGSSGHPRRIRVPVEVRSEAGNAEGGGREDSAGGSAGVPAADAPPGDDSVAHADAAPAPTTRRAAPAGELQ
ncbi:Sec-independent protein translocase subunit TatA/TatB [Georgenia sp. Z1344]|uniref:Sec-independent protein translocase subunit TatA/TatB n=1 Tax=Georgenia sp. Z1344 TaxID=3416706 RepID=UPI003CF1DF15